MKTSLTGALDDGERHSPITRRIRALCEEQKHGTFEWAHKTFNVCLGCPHDCWYCYAKSIAMRFSRTTAATWKTQIPLPVKLKEAGRGKPTTIMFPSTHDITPECLDLCIDAIDRMLKRGHRILIVSKPHVECISAICEHFHDYKDRMLFRFTIGSTDNNVLQAWEPNAPKFEERLLCLEMAHAQGCQTSVSCEPMLDDAAERVVTVTLPFVSETIWIGLMNDVKQRLTLNGAPPEVHQMGEQLMSLCSREMIAALHSRLKDNPKIRWKDSIKKMLELDRPTRPGEDRRHDNINQRTRNILTIGTRGMHDESFLRLIKEHNVDAVIDIRLRNRGRYYIFAHREHIQELLARHGIAYAHELLFAPTQEILRAYRATDNWPEYVADFSTLIQERNMVAIWKANYAGFHNPCLLCAEDTPAKCHRRLLAEHLSKEFGVPINHIEGSLP